MTHLVIRYLFVFLGLYQILDNINKYHFTFTFSFFFLNTSFKLKEKKINKRDNKKGVFLNT